ncbi:hypothetical protein E2542_SST27233 [Spatholobus suberectus]|nr:hypothetical protein E2542_SST27233 [Spatholobus suberectus]
MWRLPSLTPSPTTAPSVSGQFNIEAWPQNPPSRNRLTSCRRLRREPSPSPMGSSSRSTLASPPDRKAGTSLAIPFVAVARATFETGNPVPAIDVRASPYPSPRRADSRQHEDQELGEAELKLLEDAATVQEPISASEITVARLWSLEIFDSAELGSASL